MKASEKSLPKSAHDSLSRYFGGTYPFIISNYITFFKKVK